MVVLRLFWWDPVSSCSWERLQGHSNIFAKIEKKKILKEVSWDSQTQGNAQGPQSRKVKFWGHFEKK
jgi:hypothetical protein